MKTIRYSFWAIVGLVLILVGLANRDMVTLRAMPEPVSDMIGVSPDISLPLFIVIFLGVGAGLLIGFLWEWVREHRMRSEGRGKAREVAALQREVDKLREKAVGATDSDDVLAILEKAS